MNLSALSLLSFEAAQPASSALAQFALWKKNAAKHEAGLGPKDLYQDAKNLVACARHDMDGRLTEMRPLLYFLAGGALLGVPFQLPEIARNESKKIEKTSASGQIQKSWAVVSRFAGCIEFSWICDTALA